MESKVYFYIHFYVKQIYMHDVWTEFMLVPKKLYIGTGLHYWNGVSRMANASTLNFMTLDAPIFNWYTTMTRASLY